MCCSSLRWQYWRALHFRVDKILTTGPIIASLVHKFLNFRGRFFLVAVLLSIYSWNGWEKMFLMQPKRVKMQEKIHFGIDVKYSMKFKCILWQPIQ